MSLVDRTTTPRTAAATFRITRLDVGSDAVRPGQMARIERERRALLDAAKVALRMVRAGSVRIGAISEYALERAIRQAEEGDHERRRDAA